MRGHSVRELLVPDGPYRYAGRECVERLARASTRIVVVCEFECGGRGDR
ncbi:MAG: hypothetical protein LRS48_02695 [Desulfurococcales archaeon]|nr:hypothetical protein [Desulfurococcales archaeon]